MYQAIGAQIAEFTGHNDLTVNLSNEEMNLSLKANRMLVSYESSVGYFKLVVPFSDFRVTKERGKARKFFKTLKSDLKGHSLVIRIYVKDRPLGLGNYEGDGEILPARVAFGEMSFKQTARWWGRLVNGHMLTRLQINNYFDANTKLESGILDDLDLIEIYSENIKIHNFADLLN
ncbi:MAG: hypothetical protein AAF843_04610 [Bacteroidota bacterium]